MIRTKWFSFSILLLLLTVMAPPLTGQGTSDPSSSPGVSESPAETSVPDLPSFKGFLRFRDGRQLFLNVRRVGYHELQVQEPDGSGWINVRFDQLAPGDRRRVWRRTMIDEEMNPPLLKGVRVTLKGGEELEGFLGVNQKQSSGNTADSRDAEQGKDPGPASVIESNDRFVLLTATEGRRVITSSFVSSYDVITVNPIRMVGAEELYEMERERRNLNTARAQWELGKLCLKTELYQNAATHFQQAAEIDASYRKPVDLRLDILRSRMGSTDQSDTSSSSSDTGNENETDSSGEEN